MYPMAALALMAGTCDVTRDVTPTTAPAIPTTAVPSTTTTTTAAPTTTFQPATRDDQLAALGARLNIERLVAIHDLDLERVRAVDGTDTIFDLDRVIIGSGGWEWVAEPTFDNIPYEVTEILLDRTDCVVVETIIDLRDVLGFDAPEEQIEVFFLDETGAASLASILPLRANSTTWEMVCDEAERTAGDPT